MSKESVKKSNQEEIESQEGRVSLKLTISCSDSVLTFIEKSPDHHSGVLIDVKKTQEACVFAAEVDVKIVKITPESNSIYQTLELSELEGHPIFITKEFNKFFGNYTHLELTLKGRMRKNIVCTNIKPYIKNVCKV